MVAAARAVSWLGCRILLKFRASGTKAADRLVFHNFKIIFATMEMTEFREPTVVPSALLLPLSGENR